MITIQLKKKNVGTHLRSTVDPFSAITLSCTPPRDHLRPEIWDVECLLSPLQFHRLYLHPKQQSPPTCFWTVTSGLMRYVFSPSFLFHNVVFMRCTCVTTCSLSLLNRWPLIVILFTLDWHLGCRLYNFQAQKKRQIRCPIYFNIRKWVSLAISSAHLSEWMRVDLAV